MYSNPWIHRFQTMWVLSALSLAIVFVIAVDWSLWVAIMVAVVGFIILSWVGITVIAQFDYNHRMAAKYGVKIENLPLYFSLFEKLTEMESQGIDTFGIPKEIDDVDDWLRFCRWQAAEAINKS